MTYRNLSLESQHPGAEQLELMQLGAASAEVEEHVSGCELCQGWLQMLEQERVALLSECPAPDYMKRLRSEAESRGRVRPLRLKLGVVEIGGSVALAAVLMLLIQRQGSHTAPHADETRANAPVAAAEQGVLAPKGDARLAVFRQRGKEQRQFRGKVLVTRGDKLRLSFQLVDAGFVIAGIETDAGDWVEFFEGKFAAGSHRPLATLEVSTEPTSGRILLGPLNVVRAAREGQQLPSLQSVRLEWVPNP